LDKVAKKKHLKLKRMKRADYICKLEEIVEAQPGTLKESELLSDAGWDSLAILGFQGLLDIEFGCRVPVEQIIACKTVGDLVALLGDKLTN